MRIHHLNCGTMRPLAGTLAVGPAPPGQAPHMVCHVLLVETERGLVLIDSGLGTRDVAQPRQRLGGEILFVARPILDPEETALRQIERLGYTPSDVRHVIVTHLDLDHAGGLADFPEAKVHLYRRELEAAMNPATSMERKRYRSVQWEHGPDWCAYDTSGEPWFGFECVRQLGDLPPEILLVPLIGHSRGHAAVAIDTEKGWLLHCGDSYFHHSEVTDRFADCPLGMRLFQGIVQVDRTARLDNQARLRALSQAHSDRVRLFSAHDAHEFAQTHAGSDPVTAPH